MAQALQAADVDGPPWAADEAGIRHVVGLCIAGYPAKTAVKKLGGEIAECSVTAFYCMLKTAGIDLPKLRRQYDHQVNQRLKGQIDRWVAQSPNERVLSTLRKVRDGSSRTDAAKLWRRLLVGENIESLSRESNLRKHRLREAVGAVAMDLRRSRSALTRRLSHEIEQSGVPLARSADEIFQGRLCGGMAITAVSKEKGIAVNPLVHMQEDLLQRFSALEIMVPSTTWTRIVIRAGEK